MENKKTISVYKAYEVCNKYHLFTEGSNSQYNKFFKLCQNGLTRNELKTVLFLVSEVEDSILDIAVAELLEEIKARG